MLTWDVLVQRFLHEKQTIFQTSEKNYCSQYCEKPD